MISLLEMQKLIIANRLRRGWPSATDLAKTTEGLAEEVGEWAKARKRGDREEMIDALGDITVYCLGAAEILGVDLHVVVDKIVSGLPDREHKGHH